jgi:hypothetical protein
VIVVFACPIVLDGARCSEPDIAAQLEIDNSL